MVLSQLPLAKRKNLVKIFGNLKKNHKSLQTFSRTDGFQLMRRIVEYPLKESNVNESFTDTFHFSNLFSKEIKDLDTYTTYTPFYRKNGKRLQETNNSLKVINKKITYKYSRFCTKTNQNVLPFTPLRIQTPNVTPNSPFFSRNDSPIPLFCTGTGYRNTFQMQLNHKHLKDVGFSIKKQLHFNCTTPMRPTRKTCEIEKLHTNKIIHKIKRFYGNNSKIYTKSFLTFLHKYKHPAFKHPALPRTYYPWKLEADIAKQKGYASPYHQSWYVMYKESHQNPKRLSIFALPMHTVLPSSCIPSFAMVAPVRSKMVKGKTGSNLHSSACAAGVACEAPPSGMQYCKQEGKKQKVSQSSLWYIKKGMSSTLTPRKHPENKRRKTTATTPVLAARKLFTYFNNSIYLYWVVGHQQNENESVSWSQINQNFSTFILLSQYYWKYDTKDAIDEHQHLNFTSTHDFLLAQMGNNVYIPSELQKKNRRRSKSAISSKELSASLNWIHTDGASMQYAYNRDKDPVESKIPFLSESDQVTFVADSKDALSQRTVLAQQFTPYGTISTKQGGEICCQKSFSLNKMIKSSSLFWGIPFFRKNNRDALPHIMSTLLLLKGEQTKPLSRPYPISNIYHRFSKEINSGALLGSSQFPAIFENHLKGLYTKYNTPISACYQTYHSEARYVYHLLSSYVSREWFEANRYPSVVQDDIKGMKHIHKVTQGSIYNTFTIFPGQLLTYGEAIANDMVTTESGQVLYVDSQKTIIRKAQTVLIYSQAIIAVLSGEWIKKGTPLMSLSYQKLVTGDIVQGLPKIEQFFEAPVLKDGTFWSDSLQAKLNQFFQEQREQFPLAEAVRKGFSEIQRVLVEGVQRVYISQGVLIADKHLEVIVRQMTCKGRILYSGDTGFLRNELVSLDKIESVNQVTYGQKALYHPQVRGITDASLESESFLSAASFQETTRVLSRDAIIGKTDLMRGLKERVIVGELIQAGTGLANNSVYNLL